MQHILNNKFLAEAFGSTPVDNKRDMFNYVEKDFDSFSSVLLELEELIKNNVIEYEIDKKAKTFTMYVQENNSTQYKYNVKLNAKDFDIDNEDSLYYFVTNVFGDFIPTDATMFKSIWDGGNAGVKSEPVYRDEDSRGQNSRSEEINNSRVYVTDGKELEDNSDVVDKKTKIKKKKNKAGEFTLPYMHEPSFK